MKIESSGKPFAPIVPAKSGEARARRGDAASSAASSDNVEIQPAAKSLQALAARLGAQPTFDSAKVEEIKTAIASGKFSIRPEAIADKLMASVKELLAEGGQS